MGRQYACVFAAPRLDCQSVDLGVDQGELDPPTRRFQQVVGGSQHLCGLDLQGEPRCWGWDLSGQTEVPATLEVRDFALGYENTCTLDPEGRPTCWGSVWTGVNDAPDLQFQSLAVAERLACGWSLEQGWACWGAWLGLDQTRDGYAFTWELPDGPADELAAGGLNLCAADTAGALSCWGVDNWGVTRPPSGEGWHHLSVGLTHACAFDAEDQVVCWGDLDPWREAPAGDWVAYRAGPRFDCGLTRDGAVVCWGCTREDPFTCDWDDPPPPP